MGSSPANLLNNQRVALMMFANALGQPVGLHKWALAINYVLFAMIWTYHVDDLDNFAEFPPIIKETAKAVLATLPTLQSTIPVNSEALWGF